MTPDEVAEQVTILLGERRPTLGGGRFVCVDGPAGSGKTTLGRAVARAASRLGSVRLLHMDDMYEGWDGLGGDLTDRIDREVVGPLRGGRPGGYRRFDWAQDRFAEWHDVHPVDTLVLEGVGSGSARYADAITLLVWVEAPADLRQERGVERGGPEVLPHWRRWMEQEEVLFAAERTRDRADLLVDGTGAQPTRLV